MDAFLAVSDPKRRRIVELLSERGSMSAGEISAEFAISAAAVSQHLKVLREAGVLAVERRAQQRIYSIQPAGVEEMWQWLSELRSFWSARLDALESALLEEEKKKKRRKK